MSLTKLFSEQVGSPIKYLTEIKENSFCSIYRADLADKSFIIKQYKENAAPLMFAEAKGIQTYHGMVQDLPEWLDCNTLAFIPEQRLLCFDFVPGETLTSLIYRSRQDSELETRVHQAVFQLGLLVGEFYSKTLTNQDSSALLYEDIILWSQQLQSTPLLGRVLWSHEGTSAQKLVEDMQATDVPTCFAHGNLVPDNIRITGDRVGLIGFSHSNPHSHVLSDRYSFRLAVANMKIPNAYKKDITHTFDQGIRHIPTQAITHQFYYEYHRRRWLLQKVYSKNVWEWWQFVKGLTGFARQYALTPKHI